MTLYELEQHTMNWLISTGYHVGAPLVSAGFALFATADSSGIGALVGALGPSGVLAWYVYYTVRHVLPKKDDQIVKMQEIHDSQQKDTREHYETVISRQTEFHREQRDEDRRCLDRIGAALDKQSDQFHAMVSHCGVKSQLTQVQSATDNDT